MIQSILLFIIYINNNVDSIIFAWISYYCLDDEVDSIGTCDFSVIIFVEKCSAGNIGDC